MKLKFLILYFFCIVANLSYSQNSNNNNSDADSKAFYVNYTIPTQGNPMYTDMYGAASDIYGNSGYAIYSHISSPVSYLGIKLEPVLRIINTDFIKLQLSGSITYTNSSIFASTTSETNNISSTSSVEELDYTYGAELDFGTRWIKIFGMYEGGNRNITYANVGSSSSIELSTGSASSAVAEYNYWRAGGGINFRLNSKGTRESYLKLIYFVEQPDYGYSSTGYGLEIKSTLNFYFHYFPDYPIAGQPSYTVDNPGTKQAFWYIGIGRTFNF